MLARYPQRLCMNTQRCARLCQSVCRGWLACGSRRNVWAFACDSARWGSTPLISRVQIPPYAKSVSPVDWFCPSGRKKNGTPKLSLIVCENVFYSDVRYHSAKREVLRCISQSNAKGALPENGYRVIRDSAKRFLSTLCRGYSNFQPLLLHE